MIYAGESDISLPAREICIITCDRIKCEGKPTYIRNERAITIGYRDDCELTWRKRQREEKVCTRKVVRR
jgi:hypothetical protein